MPPKTGNLRARSAAALVLGLLVAAPAAAQAIDPAALPPPLPIVDGVAPVAPANTARRPGAGAWPVALAPDPARADRPVVSSNRNGAVAGQLRRLTARGEAAGLAGWLYDNRDRAHSELPVADFPQLSRTRYAEPFINAGLDNGIAGRFRFPLPTIGNSSTALTQGPLARSLGRLALADQAAALRAYGLYASNHLYVYPEHRDHDAETGDQLFTISPYFVLSQGSSYSDRPFLNALVLTAAALRPDTRARLEEEGLLASTLQMVMRRTLTGVQSEADYLSQRAHRSALRRERLRVGAMVSLANSLTPETIPPMVRLSVEQDFEAWPGRDYLADNLGEVLYTTPSAIARLWRSFALERTVRLSAAPTQAPNDRELAYRWVLLRGDPSRVTIRPQGPRGESADITIRWHDLQVVSERNGMTSNRIDIGVFANNGAVLSAPAMFSVLFPVHQDRIYRPDGTGAVRLAEISYAKGAEDKHVDPALWPVAGWTDRLSFDADGRITRVERRAQGAPVRFLTATAQGFAELRPNGQLGAPVRHRAVAGQGGVLALTIAGEGETAQ